MTLSEALARLSRLRDRRITRANNWHGMADACDERLNNADDVMAASQREMLADMRDAALRHERSMLEDAEAIGLVLDAPDYYEYREALSDLVHLMSEEDALNGGGPGFSARWEAAKRRAFELFEP